MDLPIAMLVEGGNHEYGHVLRAWPGDYHMQVTQWPWPIPLSGLEVWMTTLPPSALSGSAARVGFHPNVNTATITLA